MTAMLTSIQPCLLKCAKRNCVDAIMKRDLIVSAMFYHNMQDFVLVLEENLLNGVIEISAVSSLLIYAAEFVQSFI